MAQAGRNMATLSTTAYNDNRSDYQSRRLGTLIESNISGIEATITMIESNLNSLLRENINKAEYEMSMQTQMCMLRAQLSMLRTKEINIVTTSTTTLEVI